MYLADLMIFQSYFGTAVCYPFLDFCIKINGLSILLIKRKLSVLDWKVPVIYYYRIRSPKLHDLKNDLLFLMILWDDQVGPMLYLAYCSIWLLFFSSCSLIILFLAIVIVAFGGGGGGFLGPNLGLLYTELHS